MQEQSINKNEQLSFVNLALALASDYISIYVIDSNDDSYVEYVPRGEEKDLVPVSQGENFFEDVPHNVRELVHKDDQEVFIKAFRKDNIVSSLENGRAFTITYRIMVDGSPKYLFLKAIRTAGHSIVIGVRDIDEQKRRELESEKESRTYSEIASSLASLYEVIYHIDMETGYFTVYSTKNGFKKLDLGLDEVDFFECTKSDLESSIYPDDRERVMHELEKDVLLENLHKAPSVSLTYRQMLQGQPCYMNIFAFIQKSGENNEEHLVIAVRNVDEQMKHEAEYETYMHIAGSLASRYEVIYYIDVDTNEYTQYSASEQYAKLGTTRRGEDFFKDAARDIREYIHAEDIQPTLIQLQKDILLSNMEKTGSATLSYRQFLDGRQQHMKMLVVRPKNDPHHLVIGVLNVEEQITREKSIQAESQTFSEVALALARRYEVIYRVNIVTNEYVEYNASDQYAKLKVGMTGADFFAESQENMKRDIYHEDLPMMSVSMQKENLLNSLDSFGKTILNYRLMLDGRAQYVSLYAVRPRDDSEHIIVAVANVDAAKRMEIAYQNAVDMANRDALTGVKNKRAYVQAEADLDEQLAHNVQPEFAVLVCDVNGLKNVNDTRGHNEGDDFICKACGVICDTFKHSPVFRIGGDEFVALLRGQDYEHRFDLLDTFRKALDENRYEGVVLLASGMTEYDPERDLRVQDVFERADAMMYSNKKLCKNR